MSRSFKVSWSWCNGGQVPEAPCRLPGGLKREHANLPGNRGQRVMQTRNLLIYHLEAEYLQWNRKSCV